MKRVFILTNSINGLYSFRKELVEDLIKEKNDIGISAPLDLKSAYFREIGCNMIETCFNRRGINPLADLKLLFHYIKIMKREKPDIVLTYTIKPNIYGGLACRLLVVPLLSNITGLGTSIESKGWVRTISLFLYRLGLKRSSNVFFQNGANRKFFIEEKIVKAEKSSLIPGSGVNLDDHCFEKYPQEDKIIKFLFIGRIMRAKGVDELFEAARLIKKDYPNTEFHFIGTKEEDYEEKLKELTKRGIIHYHGRQLNVHPFIKDSHALIQPSHHEGMSNVLLEAVSTGRPVIASDIPGCRETFNEGISGFGFKAKDVDCLVQAIIKFIEIPYEEKKKMGIAGRRKMEKEFDRNIVIKTYMEEINSITGEKNT